MHRFPRVCILGGVTAVLLYLAATTLMAATFGLSPGSLTFAAHFVGTTSSAQTIVLANQDRRRTLQFGIARVGDFAAVDTCGGTVAPLATCNIQVTFTPTAAGTRPGSITITDTAKNSNKMTASLSGTGVAAGVDPFTLAPTSLTFTNTFQGATSSSTLVLTNNQLIPATGITLATAGPFSATGCAAPLGAGSSCTITVTFAPGATDVGAVAGQLTATSSTGANASASLSGTALRRVTVAPNPLPFGNVTVASTSAPSVITVTNNQSTRINLGNPLITFGGPAAGEYSQAATTCGPRLNAGASCTISILFTPTRGGSRGATLGVNSNTFGSPHTIALSGTGTTPLTISPPALAFDNVNVGLASASKPVTIQNNQSIAAALTSVTTNGDFATTPAGTSCGSVLAANSSCTVAVVASPTVAGLAIGNLVIASDTSEPTSQVVLTATGVNGVTGFPASLTFGTQTTDTTSLAQQVVLTNHQAVPAVFTTSVVGDYAAVNDCSGTIPASSTCTASITFTPTELGPRSGTATFDSTGALSTIAVALSGTGVSAPPPAAVVSVAPGEGAIGTNVLGVIVTGNGSTHFAAGSTVSFGDGITVSNLQNVTLSSLIVDLQIASDAVPGGRLVTVTTPLDGSGTEVASLANGFIVSSSASRTLASVTPSQGAQGQTLDVAIVGNGTHFQQGATFANFGDGVTATLTVTDQTHATAHVTVSPTTTLGWRSVTMATGGEIASLASVGGAGPGFNVVAGNASLTTVDPASGVQGTAPFVVTLTGSQTNFQQGATNVSFGNGINVGQIQVLQTSQLTVEISIAADASVDTRDVTATTGGEVATLLNGFTVVSTAVPQLDSVTPAEGAQGQTLTLTLEGSNTQFTSGAAPTLTLGSNIEIKALTVVDADTITANINIDALAFTGSRASSLTAGGTTFPFNFTVLASGAAIVGVTPPSGPQGGTVNVLVTGDATHWQQGTTTASFPNQCVEPIVNLITITSATSAVLNLQIPAGACVGPHLLQLATGGEVVTTSFGVYQATPSVGLSPSNAMVGTSLTVNFVGQFTHFNNGTTAVIDGTDVDIESFDVSSPASATARFAIAADAAPGLRTVTLTTPQGQGAFEIVTAAFAVGSTVASLTAIEPFHATPGSTTSVTIRGSFTTFDQTTSVGFGPNVTTGPVNVLSQTELSVQVTVDAAAAIGWRSAFVNTGTEQLTIGYRIDGPEAPAIVAVTPSSGVQGESLPVTIVGVNTTFDASSQLILGAGVTVSNFVVTSPTTATATVQISPTAPVGPNSVLVLTGEEIASGAGFSVTRGAAQILSVTPSVAQQSQVLNVALVGQGTNWLQGATTADFGSGVIVNQLTVTDFTHATAQITVLSTAAAGFHTVATFTDGEYVARVQGFVVELGTPVLSSSTPNTAAQGAPLVAQVLGLHTQWVQNVTEASYGEGVVVTSVQVNSPTSAVVTATVDPTAFASSLPLCRPLTITTGTEQVSLPNQLCISRGPAVVQSVSPNAAPQGSTLTVQIVGQQTHFEAGVTTASFGDIGVSNVTVTSPTEASVDLSVSINAQPGFKTATLTTRGEVASLDLAFNVQPGTPTLNGAAPLSGQQGQSLTVRLIGQYTDWQAGTTTVTFGQGITVGAASVVNGATLDVPITIDTLASLGGRTVTVTTGTEIVAAPIFVVTAGGGIISNSSPENGNQGQDIVLAITGQNTNWQQGLTQFAMSGPGGDIKVNYVLINSPTSATAGISIAPTAMLGARSIYMLTGGEALVHANSFIVTGGVPSIGSVAPGSAKPGDTAVNVVIAGLHTDWLTGTTTVDFGPGITVTNYTVNNDTSISAVIDVDAAAGLGTRTVVVRSVSQTGVQALTGNFQVVSPQPPTPFISYLSPSVGLRGQTLTVTIAGQHTHWSPELLATTIDFGDLATTGITVNSFQVTSPTSARVNITIANDAAFGTRTVSIETDTDAGAEVVQSAFAVVQATPALTIVDPVGAMQGAAATVHVLGQYTAFTDETEFDFGLGVEVTAVEVLGPGIARVDLAVDQLAPQGFRLVTATTDDVPVSGAGFVVTPSLAVIATVGPNTARQQETIVVAVAGLNTHWDSSSNFALTGGINVLDADVIDATHATLTLFVTADASLGIQSISATTGGEIATLANAFVVQPGTQRILSSSPGSGRQQEAVILTILGQETAWDESTTVALGDGITVGQVNVTSPTSLTVQVTVHPLTWLGYRSLTVTTGTQVLTLPNAFLVADGPAAIALLSPNQAGQGEDDLDVTITGVNTHFAQGATTADFGQGILVNTVTVHSATSATANISIATDALVAQNTVTVTTPYETASILLGFTIQQTTQSLQFVSPASGAQGATIDVTVVGLVTNFDDDTTFDFGPGVTVNDVDATSPTQATVNITVSPVAARTTRNVTATTDGVTVTGTNLFTVTQGLAYISAVTPGAGQRGQNGLDVVVSGNGTHFTAATPTIDFGPGVTVTLDHVNSDTELHVSVDIAETAPLQYNDVVVTTLGEVARLDDGFQVQSLPPVANAGTDQTVFVGDTVSLNGSGSTDPSSLPLTYSWSFLSKAPDSSAVLTGATTATPTFVADRSGAYQLSLVVHNGFIASQPSTVTITAVKQTPIIAWPTPEAITYGTALSTVQLNAAANISGSPIAGAFVYTPASGTVLQVGENQQLSVEFTPADTIRYNSETAMVEIDVARAILTVKADDKVRSFATANPPLTYHVAGFVNADTASVVTGAPDLTSSALSVSPVGTYPINVAAGSLTASNYTFAFVPGTLTVLASSASNLVQHIGLIDPITEGFENRGGMQASGPVRNDSGFDAWQVTGTGCCSYFNHPIDYAGAFAEGWRLTGRVRVVGTADAAYIVLNPGNDRPRFDVGVAAVGSDAVVSLTGSALSFAVPGAAHQWLQLELVYDPNTSSASLFINGVRRLTGYTGWSFAQENRGVLFGTSQGTANFNLVRFDVGSLVVDFEDQPDTIDLETPFPSSYWGIMWTNWLHAAPYAAPFQPDGINAVYAAVDGATLTFSERVFVGAEFSRYTVGTGDVYFELYHQGQLVATSALLADTAPQRTFLASGYAGLVDEVRVRSLDGSMTPTGSAWVMDNLTFGTQGAKATPVITWPNPAPIAFGTALGAAQLNALANVPGAFVYSPTAGTVLPTGPAQQLSVVFTPTDIVHYVTANDAALIDVVRAQQLTLVVTSPVVSAPIGATFTVGTTGGSGGGGISFAATGACTNVDAEVTITASSGTCAITATKAADTNYEATTSAAFLVTATQTITLQFAGSTASFAAGIPGSLTVRLVGSGLTVPAPETFALTATSSNPQCVVVQNGTFVAGASSAIIPVDHDSAALPCTSTVTVESAYGNATINVMAYPAEASYLGRAAVSYYNPTPVPSPAGVLAARQDSVSYYNPATVPSSDSTVKPNVAAVSYYNPALVPSPTNTVTAKVAAVSYYNPATVPNPGGTAHANGPSVSYYNPATVPSPTGAITTNVTAVSYCNPSVEIECPPSGAASLQQEAMAVNALVQPQDTTPAATVAAVSIANGPTATSVDPVRLSRSASNQYVLTIEGANLSAATAVTFVGLEFDVSVGVPVVSDDGRRLTVDVYVLARAPLGTVSIVVSGPGWSTPQLPTMQVEIVP